MDYSTCRCCDSWICYAACLDGNAEVQDYADISRWS